MNGNRRVLVGLALAALTCALSSRAMAVSSVTLSASGTTVNSTTITAGQSFSVDVGLNADVGFTGLTLLVDSSAAGQFSIVGRTAAGSNLSNFLTDPITSNLIVVSKGLLNPRNGADLGYSAADVTSNIPAGVYPVETLQFAVSAGTLPGDYIIESTTDSILSDAAFDEIPLGVGTFTVHVAVPEPAGGIVFCGVMSAMLHRRRRR